jgi:CRP-like cAMP-binding protein
MAQHAELIDTTKSCMFLTAHETNPLASYGALAQQAFAQFCSLSGLKGEAVTLAITDDLYADRLHHTNLYLITDGTASLGRNKGNILTFEAGDIIGLEECLNTPLGTYSLSFAIRCTRFALSDITKAISSDAAAAKAWCEFLTYRSAAFGAGLLQTNTGEKIFNPVISTFRRGSIIIAEQSPSTEVYTLLSGHASVLVQGIQVGEILEDEIFGALAALSQHPRTATVVAASTCTVLSVSKDQFIELIEARPQTIQKLVLDMARTINDLNQKVIALTNQGTKSTLFR